MTDPADLKLLDVLRLRAQAQRYAQDAQDSTLPASYRKKAMEYAAKIRQEIEQEQAEKGGDAAQR